MQHKIAAFKRLVALAMLSSLLFSSTAVHAGTEGDVQVTSPNNNSNVSGTGSAESSNSNDNLGTTSGTQNTTDNATTTDNQNNNNGNNESGDNSSSDNQQGTTSGSTDNNKNNTDTNTDNTNTNTNQDPQNPEGGDEPQEPVCEHEYEVKYKPVDNINSHKAYKECSKCHDIQDMGLYECTMAADGRTYVNKQDSNTHHTVKGKCEKCHRDMSYDEECTFVAGSNGNVKYCSKEGCENAQDSRAKDPVLHTVVKDIDGTVINEDGNHRGKNLISNPNGTVFIKTAKRIKVRTQVYCEMLDDEDEADWTAAMKVVITIRKGADRTTQDLKLVNFDDATKTATYEWVSDATTSQPITVEKVTANYDINGWVYIGGEKAFRSAFRPKAGTTEMPLRVIVQNVVLSEQIKKITKQSVTGGTWTMKYDGDWYSKNVKGHTANLSVIFDGTIAGDIGKPELVRVYYNGSEYIAARSGEAISGTFLANHEEWSLDKGALIGRRVKVDFQIPANKPDGVYVYRFKASMNGVPTDSDAIVKIYLDNTAPTYEVVYDNGATAKNGKYFNQNVSFKVIASDVHFDTNRSNINIDKKKTAKFDKNTLTASITASDEGTHILGGKLVDLAGNERDINDQKQFVIDKTAPTLKINFDNYDVKHGKYYKAERVATFVLEDRNIDDKDAKMANVKFTAEGGTATISEMTGSNGKYTGSIRFDQDGVYKIKDIDAFKFTDKAGNKVILKDKDSDKEYTKQFVIDKTAPEIEVEFDNNNALNNMYYKDIRKAQIKINEKNFRDTENAEQLVIAKNNDDLSQLPGFAGFKDAGKTHTTTLTFDKDGRYGFNLYCEDLAGNVSSTYKCEDFVIDLTMPELEISGVTDKSANNGRVVPVITSKDLNLNDGSTEISLYGANRGKVVPGLSTTSGSDSFTYTISDFAREKSNDDLYTLKVKLTDLAGNTVEKSVQYSINRFGSVFVLGDGTRAMIDGYYVVKPQDVTVTEINVDELSYKEVSVSYDGNVKELKEGKGYTTTDSETENGWHSISYTINASNFKKDGMYGVTVYSEDRATNKQSNQSKDTQIEFLVDMTAPSVVVAGLEDGGVYEEDNHDFSINAADTIGVKDMKVYLNDEKLAGYTAKELLDNGGTAVLTIPTSDSSQNVTIECTDVAGNVTNLEYNNIVVSLTPEEVKIEAEGTPKGFTGEFGGEGEILNKTSSGAIIAIIAIIVVILGAAGFVVYRRRQ